MPESSQLELFASAPLDHETGNDMLLYWEDDSRTRVVTLYLESFGNSRSSPRHAARIGRRKPSRSKPAGGRAGVSQTAAVATQDAVVSALFGQTGVIRVDTTPRVGMLAHELRELAEFDLNSVIAGPTLR